MHIIPESCYEVYDRKIVILENQGVNQGYYKSTGTNKGSKRDHWIPFYGFAFCPVGGIWFIKHPDGKIIDQNISDQIEVLTQDFDFPTIEPIFWTQLNLSGKLIFLDKIVSINKLFDQYKVEEISKNPRLNEEISAKTKKWLHDLENLLVDDIEQKYEETI